MAIIDDFKRRYWTVLANRRRHGRWLGAGRTATPGPESIRHRLLRTSSLQRAARALYRQCFETMRYPATVSEMRGSELYNGWWYYGIELMPEVSTSGIYPPDLPMLARILMRRCNVASMDCLDLGSMEGLIPVLLRRRGAGRILATDAFAHCFAKMAAVKHYYRADFDFREVGLMYDLSRKLKHEGAFDFINLSGLLYHVFSPMHVLAGVRPLLKRGGLMIVTTNVVIGEALSMEFNCRGRLQAEQNTFWYPSVALLDYLLRYFQLLPIDCLYLPRSPSDPVRYAPGMNAAQISVACRAVEEIGAEHDDWARRSTRTSWESIGLWDRAMMSRQPRSTIQYSHEPASNLLHSDGRSIELSKAVRETPPMSKAGTPQDTHHLHLDDVC